MAKEAHPPSMTPLQRYLDSVREQDGNSLEKMARRASNKGYEISGGRIWQIIRKTDQHRLDWPMLHTLAAACGVDVEVIEALEKAGAPTPEQAKRSSESA